VTTLGKIVLKKQKIYRVSALWHSAKYCLKKESLPSVCVMALDKIDLKKINRVTAVRH
jgi:hypothetical protein